MKPLKILLGILGMDQHEVGALAVASMLRDAGLEVVYLGRFNLPPHIVKAAVQEDADVIGLSCHSWEYIYYLDELMQLLQEQDLEIPVVVGGSVLTPDDERAMRKKGISAAFGPGASADSIVSTVQQLAGGRERNG